VGQVFCAGVIQLGRHGKLGLPVTKNVLARIYDGGLSKWR
jgi:hypothetical protein